MKVECQYCERKLASKDALSMHFESKHQNDKKAQKTHKTQALIRRAIPVLLVLGFFILAYSTSVNAKVYPPTDMRGHIESSPPSHKLREPLDLRVQRHMLEHSDGAGPPGVIINYNCDYGCEPGLIENLEVFADRFNNVYVAPFPKIDGKIILTRRGKMKILEEFDAELIDLFIRGVTS